MWLRPSGYVIGAVLAGAISAVGLSGLRPEAMPLIVLWLAADLLSGALARSIRVLAWPRPRGTADQGRWRHIAVSLGCVAAVVGLASLLSDQARQVLLLACALCAMASLVTSQRQPGSMVAVVSAIQVLAAWSAAFLLLGGKGQAGLALAVVACVGTLSRRSHTVVPRAWSRWSARLCWTGLVAALVVARQPLLAGVVALTACADDLHRLQPLRNGDAGMLAATAWVGAWVLVAIASAYWAAPA